ncbi:MAG: hypothetical protein IPL12_12835 [Bacteroidetes bacterium]|nr:hypothetical protein [Bacteroidota bacterium]
MPGVSVRLLLKIITQPKNSTWNSNSATGAIVDTNIVYMLASISKTITPLSQLCNYLNKYFELDDIINAHLSFEIYHPAFLIQLSLCDNCSHTVQQWFLSELDTNLIAHPYDYIGCLFYLWII